MSPAVPLFVAAVLGGLVGFSTTPALSNPWLWALALLVVAAGTLAAPGKTIRAGALIAVAFVLAGTIATIEKGRWTRTTDALLVGDEAFVLEGLVADVSPSAAGGSNLMLDVTGAFDGPTSDVGERALEGRIRVGLRSAAGALDIRAGDRVRVFGRPRALHPADRPGAFDAELFGIARGLHARLSVHDPQRIVIVEEGAGSGIWSAARARLRTRLGELTTPREAGVVLALLIGDTSSFDEEQHAIYRAVGAGHLLAVSGLQVTLLAVLLFFMARVFFGLMPYLGRRSKTRFPSALTALVGVWAFVMLCGAPPSCVRAAAMATAGLLAMLADRQASGLDALGLAGLVTVLLSPTSVIDPSFLLSYAAVLGLLLASPKTDALDVTTGQGWLWPRARATLLGAAGAGLLTLPVSAHLFGEVSPGGLVANIVLVPVAALLQVPALGLGLLGALVGSSFLVDVGAACAGVLEALCEGLGSLMGGLLEVGAPGGVVALLLTLAAGLVVAGLSRKRWGVCAIGATGSLLVLAWFVVEPDGLRITVLPVGQGTAPCSRCPTARRW